MKSINDTTFNIQDKPAIVLKNNGVYQRYHGSLDTSPLLDYVNLKTSTAIIHDFDSNFVFNYMSSGGITKDTLVLFIRYPWENFSFTEHAEKLA